MSILNQIAELARATTARDTKFLKSLLYYFELRIPAAVRVGPDVPFLFPLVLSPESLTMTEPFTVDRSFTNGGGLFVEEQGIVAREITIAGTTGWKPKRTPPQMSNFSSILSPKHRSYTRHNALGADMLLALSGQRHFQYLQDAVFRTYADLKQDPSTSEGTSMYFHIPKDDEHWRVIPLNFTLNRDTSSPLTYRYNISLLAVKPGPLSELTFSEDFSVLNTLKDSYRVLRAAITLVRSAIQDLSGVQGELRTFSAGFVSLLDGAASVADAAADFVDGTTTLIAIPFDTALNSIKSGLDALLELNTGIRQTSALGAGANLLNAIRKVIDGVTMIASYPGHFRNNVQAAVDRYQQRTDQALSRRTDALAAAATNLPPQSARAFDQLGSALLPGDAARANENLGLGRATPNYTSAFEYAVEQADTLANLAARFLGDARNWKYVAIFNNLQPPFISEEGLPGTLRVGDKILIPSFAQPPEAQASPVTLGVRPEESAEKHALGSDLRMELVPGSDQYDFVIDLEGGAVDVRVVSGIPNLKQAMRTRIITERGSDTLYRELGCARLVGLSVTAVDLETAQVRLGDAILADPRINAVRELTFDQDQPDSVVAELTAEVRGFTRPERIRVAVGV